MQIILQLGSIAVPFAIGITINHANSMPFFSIVLAMADLHHHLRSSPKTAKPLILLAIAGSVPNFLGNGEWGMGNGEADKKIFRPPKISSARALPRPCARSSAGRARRGEVQNQIPSKAQKSAGLTMKSALG